MPNYGKYYIAVRLLLLKQYLEANAGKNRIVSRKELEVFLEEHDMGVEKKTIYADLAVLGNICGLQLEYDVHKKGYRLLNPPFEPYELRLMVDGVQSSKFITKEKAREVAGKIKALVGSLLYSPGYIRQNRPRTFSLLGSTSSFSSSKTPSKTQKQEAHLH